MIPKRFRNLATGLVVGIVLGLGIAVMRELLDNTVKTAETLEDITGAGAVGFILSIEKSPRTTRFRLIPTIPV